MFIQQFFSGQLHEAPATVAYMALAGALLGIALWLAGSRFSRPIITLALVALGAWIGIRFPRWTQIPISRWATCIGLALMLGVLGWILHRAWVGIGLSLVLASWVAVGVWTVYGNIDNVPQKPEIVSLQDTVNYYVKVWAAMPVELRRVGPFLCGIAVVSGLTVAILWARLAGFALYSLLGVTLAVTMSLIAMEIGRPQMMALLPQRSSTQVAMLLFLVLIGALVQWRLAPPEVAIEGQPSDPGEQPRHPRKEEMEFENLA